MALVLIDRAQETATANTTVSFTLTGASTGYQTFAGVGNTNTTYYGSTDGTNWETGIGTYSSTGPTLTRTTILASSNAGAAVTFTGAVTVWVDYPASKSVGSQTGYFDSAYQGTFVDGIVMDYVTGQGRISVGGADDLVFYNGGVAGAALGHASSNGDWDLPGVLTLGNGSVVAGATNPIVRASSSANSYVQLYVHNDNTGISASADLVAYPNNGTDTSGFVDLGVNSSTFADTTYTCTGPNESYLFASALSGGGTTGNLVYATDSTGSDNAHQWYVGGFTQAKSAYKMQLDGTNLYLKQPIKADGIVESTTGGFKFPDATTQTTSAFPSTTTNKVLASPDGSTGTPTYRALVSNDIPDLLLTKLPEAWTKMSCHAATTANITLSGTQTIDGVALIAGNRCLVKNQTTAQDNGIYDVSASTWTRSADANTISKIAGGVVNIDAGTTNGGKLFDTDLKATDTLGTTVMNWYSLVDINGATFVGSLTTRAGTATAGTAPLYITSGTSLTTAAAGAVEYDGTVPYFSIAASTRGAIPTEQWVVLTGTNTLTSQTGAQPIFDGGGGPTNGGVTLPVGTYQFECVYALTAMSATSGSFGFTLAGAATKTFTYDSTASKAGTAAATSQAGFKLFSSAAATALVTASTGTVGSAVIKGIIRVTVAGTVIPQVSLTVAAAAVVSANSYFRVSPIGNATVATVGNWA